MKKFSAGRLMAEVHDDCRPAKIYLLLADGRSSLDLTADDMHDLMYVLSRVHMLIEPERAANA